MIFSEGNTRRRSVCIRNEAKFKSVNKSFCKPFARFGESVKRNFERLTIHLSKFSLSWEIRVFDGGEGGEGKKKKKKIAKPSWLAVISGIMRMFLNREYDLRIKIRHWDIILRDGKGCVLFGSPNNFSANSLDDKKVSNTSSRYHRIRTY